MVSGKLDTSRKPLVISWLIDGTNLQCCGVGRMERHQMIAELQQIASPSGLDNELSLLVADKTNNKQQKPTPISNVVLVFDGNEEEDFQELITEPWFQVIITDGKGRRRDRADDYIVHHALPRLQQRFQELERSSHIVHLVSADKELQNRATATRMMNGGSLVYPPKFWKQYVPNLRQQQLQAFNSRHDS